MDLTIHRLRLVYKAQEKAEMPPQKGNVLRGALGAQLKGWDEALFLRWFRGEGPNNPSNARRVPPFALHCADTRTTFAPGDWLDVELTLAGDLSIDWFQLVLVWRLMGFYGFGPDRSRFSLREIWAVDPLGDQEWPVLVGKPEQWESDITWMQQMGDLFPICTADIMAHAAAFGPGTIKVDFETPCRIKVDGHLVNHPTPELLWEQLQRQAQLMGTCWGDGVPPYARSEYLGARLEKQEVEWWEWARTSHRDQTSMKLSGFVGSMTFQTDDLAAWLPLLTFGRLLHVGKATTFGNGRICVTLLKED